MSESLFSGIRGRYPRSNFCEYGLRFKAGAKNTLDYWLVGRAETNSHEVFVCCASEVPPPLRELAFKLLFGKSIV